MTVTSIHQLPMTHKQAVAVRVRMERTHNGSVFEVVGARDLCFVKEIRPMKNLRGKCFDVIVMHGRPVHSRKAA